MPLQKSSLNLRDSKNANKEQSNRLSLNTDNKYTSGSGGKNDKANLPSTSSEEREKEDKDAGTEKDNGKNGALHQCISELAASIASNEDSSATVMSSSAPKKLSSSSDRSTSSSKNTSHFVTVIEVKESKINMDQNNPSLSMDQGSDIVPDQMTSTFSSFERKPSAPPLSPSMSSSSNAAALSEANKKKMPPRSVKNLPINILVKNLIYYASPLAVLRQK